MLDQLDGVFTTLDEDTFVRDAEDLTGSTFGGNPRTGRHFHTLTSHEPATQWAPT